MNPRALRLLRGTFVTGTSVVLTSAAHIAAGGGAPGIMGLAIAMLLGSTLGLVLLAGPRLTVVRTAVVVAGGQVVFHAVFGWSDAAAAAGSGGHIHGAASASGEGLIAAPSAAHGGAAMVGAHVIAGVVSLALLLTEQRLLDGIVAATLTVVRRLVEPIVNSVEPQTARVGVSTGTLQPLGRPSRLPVPRRGPPMVGAFTH